LYVWNEKLKPDAYEFWQPNHNSSKFKLEQLKTYANNADSLTYNEEKDWYDKRSKGD